MYFNAGYPMRKWPVYPKNYKLIISKAIPNFSLRIIVLFFNSMAKRNEMAADKGVKDGAGSRLWNFLNPERRLRIFSRKSSKRGDSTGENPLAAHVSLNCVIFAYDNEGLKILLAEQGKAGKKKQLSLPGHLLKHHESFDKAAYEIASNLTGVKKPGVEPLGTFRFVEAREMRAELDQTGGGKIKDGVKVIKLAYLVIIHARDLQHQQLRKGYAWYPLKQNLSLGFDHNQVLHNALLGLQFKLKYSPLAFKLLPQKFTLAQLQEIYEAVLNKKLDKRNFRRKLLAERLILRSGEKQQGVAHKPAELYRFNHKTYGNEQSHLSVFPIV